MYGNKRKEEEECYEMIMHSLNNCYKIFTLFLKGGTDGFDSMRPLCFPLPGKPIKHSFSSLPKTRSLRFYSALMYKEGELSASLLALGHCVTSPLRNSIFSPVWNDSYCIFERWIFIFYGCESIVAPQHVESSRTRDWTQVPCTGRWILLHCTISEVPSVLFYFFLSFCCSCCY